MALSRECQLLWLKSPGKEYIIKYLPLFCPCIILFLILKGLNHAVIQFCEAFVSCPLLCYTLTAPFLPLSPSQWLVQRHSLPSQASAASGLASVLLRGDTEESRRLAVALSSLPSSTQTGYWRKGHLLQLPLLSATLSEAKVRKVTALQILGNHEHPSGPYPGATAALDFMINSNLCCK